MKKSKSDELVFLPLGGSNEIGMNFNLYGFGPAHDRKWIVVDLGVTFGDQTTPGVEIILPDPFLHRALRQGHHRHRPDPRARGPPGRGALAVAAPEGAGVRHAVHRLPAAREAARRRHSGRGADHRSAAGRPFSLGPFDLELITLTHSIPEPNGLAIKTPLGTILHTGDWKIDPEPLLGAPTDEAAIRRLGDEGVLAMVCDSTNVFVDGLGGVGGRRPRGVGQPDQEPVKGKIAVACFASNVARMDTVIRAAQACGRKVCLAGRSMHRMAAAARSVGLLQGLEPFINDDQAKHLPENEILFLCTGSQGEARAALSRIADGSHPHVKLGSGDHVVFSSRVIPGNEIPIRNLQNKLADRGVRLHTERDTPGIHVSGHPCRDELRQMYAWVRPRSPCRPMASAAT
jgi:ribonuclease J